MRIVLRIEVAKWSYLFLQLKELQQLATLITESEGAESPVSPLARASFLVTGIKRWMAY